MTASQAISPTDALAKAATTVVNQWETGDLAAAVRGLETALSAYRTAHIRQLNDLLRTTGQGGRMVLTLGIRGLGQESLNRLIEKIRRFNEFGPDNDPHGEHDFGSIDHNGARVFWKIDYYDLSLEAGSEDPADPAQTCRVLTVMLAEEY